MRPDNLLDGDDPYLTTIFSKVCMECSNYNTGKSCRAFPDGIPREIWLGKNNHTKPYKGDHGIRFEKLK
jgi:hypothetical protein